VDEEGWEKGLKHKNDFVDEAVLGKTGVFCQVFKKTGTRRVEGDTRGKRPFRRRAHQKLADNGWGG